MGNSFWSALRWPRLAAARKVLVDDGVENQNETKNAENVCIRRSLVAGAEKRREYLVECQQHECRREREKQPIARAAPEAQKEPGRSEEHTSELQSQSNLVCRL